MPAYNFDRRFALAVALGEKTQTIRATPRGAAWGKPVTLYTGQRTKQCVRLGEGVIENVFSIEIDTEKQEVTFQHGRPMKSEFIEKFAKYDGFDNTRDFFDWFRKPGKPIFEGVLIAWALQTTEARRRLVSSVLMVGVSETARILGYGNHTLVSRIIAGHEPESQRFTERVFLKLNKWGIAQ